MEKLVIPLNISTSLDNLLRNGHKSFKLSHRDSLLFIEWALPISAAGCPDVGQRRGPSHLGQMRLLAWTLQKWLDIGRLFLLDPLRTELGLNGEVKKVTRWHFPICKWQRCPLHDELIHFSSPWEVFAFAKLSGLALFLVLWWTLCRTNSFGVSGWLFLVVAPPIHDTL